MNELKESDILFRQTHRVSKIEFQQNPSRFTHYVADRLRAGLSDYISHVKIRTESTDNMVESRLELYVADPDTFWKIVQNEAEKIVLRYGRTLK